MDRHFAQVSVSVCPDCGRRWLKYLYELEAITGSGRWYLGVLTAGQAEGLTASDARALLAEMDWYFYGGSYFGGQVGKGLGPLGLDR